MVQKRHNINTIAEILIDKLETIEKNVTRLENVAQKAEKTTLKIDTTQIEALLQEQKQLQNKFITDIEWIVKNNNKRLPNRLLYLVVGALLFAVFCIVVCYFQLK